MPADVMLWKKCVPCEGSIGRSFAGYSTIVRAQEMTDAGVDIIDVGGESTRPGSDPVPLEEEVRRVIPVIQALRDASDVMISVDTRKKEVAERALDAGAAARAAREKQKP